VSRVALTTGDGSEALLPCCVPYLQLHPFVVQKDLLDLEVNAVARSNTDIRDHSYSQTENQRYASYKHLKYLHAREQCHLARCVATSRATTVMKQQQSAGAASAAAAASHPIVVMKLGVKESSEKRSRRQLFPTPARTISSSAMFSTQGLGQPLEGCYLLLALPSALPLSPMSSSFIR
jgi:hypothetical protein